VRFRDHLDVRYASDTSLNSNRLKLGRSRTEENILWSFAPHDISAILYLLGRRSLATHTRRASELHRRLARMNRPPRKAAYTFIIGDYDTLKTPAVVTEGWDYICFTDNPNLQSACWDVRLSTRQGDDVTLEDKKFAMKHMILFHQYLDGYDVTLSVGGQIEINCNLDVLFGQHFNEDDDMMICLHPERDCVYDEADACTALGKDDASRIHAHMQEYRAAGYPPHHGLYSTIIIGRRHDRQHLKDMCELWFRELKRGSQRDQLSLNYSIWRSAPIKISAISFRQQFSEARNFIIHPHAAASFIAQLYRHAKSRGARWAHPQAAHHDDSFLTWINAPADDDPSPGSLPRITNLAAYVHRIRADVRGVYPDVFRRDRHAYARWFLNHGSKEFDLPEAFLGPVHDSLNPFRGHAGFDNGLPVVPIVVELYLSIEQCSERWPSPWITRSQDNFCAWINAPADDDSGHGSLPLITNLASYVYRARADVQGAYPDVFGDDRHAFALWFSSHGSREYALPDAFVDPVRGSLGTA